MADYVHVKRFVIELLYLVLSPSSSLVLANQTNLHYDALCNDENTIF